MTADQTDEHIEAVKEEIEQNELEKESEGKENEETQQAS